MSNKKEKAEIADKLLKVRASTRHKLKIKAANQGKSMVELLDDFADSK